jgi:uncharacterized protein YgiM (DUF1202 family)
VSLVGLLASAALAETVYVQAKTAQLRAGKTSLDRVVATLQAGDELELLRRDGRWLEVRMAGGATGWIFENKISKTRPSGGDNELAALGKSFRRTETSGVTASAGARGLDKVSEGYANRAGITAQTREAVDRMAQYRVPDEEVQEFLKAGRLGEYAD